MESISDADADITPDQVKDSEPKIEPSQEDETQNTNTPHHEREQEGQPQKVLVFIDSAS